MLDQADLLMRDSNHIWPPCTPLKPDIEIPRLIVEHAKGSYLYTNEGPVIDAISSWWCKALGHQPKPVIDAIKKQLDYFEHVIGANTTYEAQVQLAEKLKQLTGKQHVFFAGDGSSAVEIALKLALHAMQIRGTPERKAFLTLSGAYHGETIATLSVSDVGCYKQPFEGMGVSSHVLHDVPYVSGISDPLMHDCSAIWPHIEAQLDVIKHTLCGVIVEPILQGAGGMKIYSADFLRRLSEWAKQNQIYLIADEIMTGLHRTGRRFASEHASIAPDMMCLSKGLTAGTTPLSCVLIDSDIYDVFNAKIDPPFLHSHTYTGHALGVVAALATLNTMESMQIEDKVRALGSHMKQCFELVAEKTGCIENIRSIGAVVAGEVRANHAGDKPIGRAISRAAQERGALLRPLGNTVYWFPPLTTDKKTIGDLAAITADAILSV